jgi:response regulator RpfG family c-di-GMP phosphodiesterase
LVASAWYSAIPAAKGRTTGPVGQGRPIGTLNHVTAEDIVKAASLVRTGKVFTPNKILRALGKV